MSQIATRTNPVKRSRHRVAGYAFLTAIALGRGSVASTPALEPVPDVLTTVRQVHELPAAQASKHVPVHLVATVTRYDAGQKLFFIEDGTGAVFVSTTKAYPVADGDRVEITGVTDSSFRTVVRTDPQVRVLGHGTLPEPVLLGAKSYTQLMSGTWDCRRVTVRGRVRSALTNTLSSGRLDLEVLTDGGVVDAIIHGSGVTNAASLIDSDILITGLVGATFDANWQEMGPVLFGANPSAVRVLQAPRQTIADLPQTRIDDVMQTQSAIDESRRVRVRGVVTAYHPGTSVVVRQGNRSLTASTRQRIELPLGSVVDLSGFATRGAYGPALKQVTIVPAGEVQTVHPYKASYSDAVSGRYNDELISVQGKVLSETHTDTLDQLTLLAGQHAVTATLEHAGDGYRLPHIASGTEITVQGICHMSITDALGDPSQTPLFFRIDMRSADDVAVICKASWWTIEHLLTLLASVSVASLAIAWWAVALRRRVSAQTGQIERTVWLERERSRLLEAISSATPLPAWITDLCGTCEALLPGIRSVCSAYEVVGAKSMPVAHLVSPECLFSQSLNDDKGAALGLFQAFHTNGRELSKHEHGVLEVFARLAALAVNQHHMSEELNYTSTHDQLTALPNRRMADACLERALVQRDRSDTMVGVVYVDVDDFKQVNEQLGDKVGDLYLQQIAARLKNMVRGTDLMARIGGDEFMLVAAGLTTVAQAEECRNRLSACFDSPFVLDGHTISGSASVGLALAPLHGTRAEDLKRQADLDLYTKKYKRRMPAPPATSDLYSAADLEAALATERFLLYYQPVFGPDGTLCGLEALLRMNDPVTGIVGPNAFIDVAEGNDVIVPLGAWVVRQAVTDAVRWNLQHAGARVMVNVSMRQVEHPGFAVSVLETLREAGLPPCCLELEITERLLMQNPPQVMRQLKHLRENGVQIAIDDFGVEHSSLTALRSLPFDTLKLDRSFIEALGEDDRALHIVGAVISIAQKMGKRIVAEGIETEQQLQALSAFEEIDLQGYYFSRPRPCDEITASLDTWILGRKLPKKADGRAVLPKLAFAS